ncbi:uncharacterized protein YfcZ (UPF0381/DUF406 family) [Mesorhizobium robiniae]|uniref:Uncharacterized protein YfcZ (UPF0381/DUF406 family) n=1 Tax=Mesorhizobium robiniae TaxID=559315 RepID=A0ABV2GXB0_9HYPH
MSECPASETIVCLFGDITIPVAACQTSLTVSKATIFYNDTNSIRGLLARERGLARALQSSPCGNAQGGKR